MSMRPAHEIAADLHRESQRLYARARDMQIVAQLLEGTHFSLPDHARASQEELLARMTPEQRARYEELAARAGTLREEREQKRTR